MDIHKVEWGMDWNDLDEDRYKWWALKTAVMNLRLS